MLSYLRRSIGCAPALLCFGCIALSSRAAAQPTIDLPNVTVRTVISGLSNPTAIAFLGPDDFLVAEKNTGRIKHYRNGELQGVVLDLAVNFASERGLLGMAVHPDYPRNNGIYLYWTCIGTETPPAWAPGQLAPAYVPSQMTCSTSNMMGVPDTNELLRVPVMGNRVDRFRWDDQTRRLVYENNLISLRSFQNDGVPPPSGQGDDNQPPRGNHNGGVLRFSQDGRLFIFMGDQGRRGQLQNLAQGPTPGLPDDQFGGAEPDDDHLTGVVLRLNADGSAPPDNPYFNAGTQLGGAAGMNLQKIYAYGFRNSFGMAVEPNSGELWITEHGDDAFDEINRVRRGMNGGWIQFAGPAERVWEYKAIENSFFAPPDTFPSLQQWRWAPSRIADTLGQARDRLVMFPGAFYSDPEFSWRWAALPVALAFVEGNGLGGQLQNDLLVGLTGRPGSPGYLLRFRMIPGQGTLQLNEPGLSDRVADNNGKYDLTETQPLIIGSGYGILTDMRMSPSGTMYLVSYTNGEVYELRRENGNGNGAPF